MDKGVAFPTCVSVNESVCHFSPLSDDTTKLKLGDVVRIDLAVQFDGYISNVAHTVVLTDKVIDGKPGDCFACAQSCLDAAHKLIFAGNTNTQVSQAWEKIASTYGVSLCEGVLSHQLKRYVIDGSKSIILKSQPDQNVDEFVFGDYEAYSIDILVSTGAGKLRETEPKTTIYKRNPEVQYHVRLKSSQTALKALDREFKNLPFSLRGLEKDVRFGLNEIRQNGMIDAYPVLSEKKGEFVVHFKSTFLVMKNDTLRVTGQAPQSFKSEKVLGSDFIKAVNDAKANKKKVDKMEIESH